MGSEVGVVWRRSEGRRGRWEDGSVKYARRRAETGDHVSQYSQGEICSRKKPINTLAGFLLHYPDVLSIW